MAIQDSPNMPSSDNSTLSGSWPRYLNALIAAWLFVSAFAWTHTMELRQDTWIVGLLMFIAALAAVAAPAFRWVNTVLAVWLFISTLALPHTMPATMWNNIIVSIVVFVLSLIPSEKPSHAGRPAPRSM